MSVLDSGADFEALLLARGCALMVRPAGSCVTSASIWRGSVRGRLEISADARVLLLAGGREQWRARARCVGKEASAAAGDAGAEVRAGAIQGEAAFAGRQATWAGAGASVDRFVASEGVGRDNGELAEQRWKRLTLVAASLPGQVTLFRRRALH
ncbi:hypothetical protein PSPO01_14977 [Paraphaeosphaeria sporulosa]